MISDCTAARRALPLLDLTSLGDKDDTRTADALCARALRAGTAAVCVWPHLVDRCTDRLRASPIAVATVANFPDGGTDIGAVVALAQAAVREGADEVDVVFPYRAWLAGERGLACDLVRSVRQACPAPIRLKVILETGRLRTAARIAAASEDAIESGADFIKTSTGKVAPAATPSAAQTMLQVIKRAERAVGFKAAGGIRTARQTGNYLRLADRIMGPGWASPATLRFGASALLDNLEQTLGW